MGILKSLKKEYKRGYKSITKTKFGKALFTAAVVWAGYWAAGKVMAANAVEPLTLAGNTAAVIPSGAINAEAAVTAGDISMSAPVADVATVSGGAGASGADRR